MEDLLDIVEDDPEANCRSCEPRLKVRLSSEFTGIDALRLVIRSTYLGSKFSVLDVDEDVIRYALEDAESTLPRCTQHAGD